MGSTAAAACGQCITDNGVQELARRIIEIGGVKVVAGVRGKSSLAPPGPRPVIQAQSCPNPEVDGGCAGSRFCKSN